MILSSKMLFLGDHSLNNVKNNVAATVKYISLTERSDVPLYQNYLFSVFMKTFFVYFM